MTEEEIKRIIIKNELSDVEMIEVIQQYIFDMKSINVKINRPTGQIYIMNMQIVQDIQLMDDLYNTCLGYYSLKFKL